MNERKWTTRTLSTLAVFVIGLIVTINFVIDPYGEFRLIEGGHNKLKLKAEKTTALKVASKLYDGKYALVFGSSRTMLLSSEIMGKPILNFSTSIYNNPGDILAFLKMLDKKQIANITNIYFLVDVNGFYYTEVSPQMLSKSGLQMESVRNINPQKIIDAWECFKENIANSENISKYIDSYGVLHKKENPFHNKKIIFASTTASDFYYNSLKKIHSFSLQHQIKTTFYTVPWLNLFNEVQQKPLNEVIQKANYACNGLIDLRLCKELLGKKSFFSDPSHLNISGLKILVKHLSNPTLKSSPPKVDNEQQNFDIKTITIAQFYKLLELKFDSIEQIIPNIVKHNRKDLMALLYDRIKYKKAFIQMSFNLGRSTALKMLLDEGRRFDENEEYINSGLKGAILSGDPQMVKDTILLGAKSNILYEFDETPLILAIKFSPSEIIIKSLLATGANASIINRNPAAMLFNESAYTMAAKDNNKEVFKVLEQATPDNELKKYSKLTIELHNSPKDFDKMNELKSLHKKYYDQKSIMYIRVQPLTLPGSALTNNTILHLDNSTYSLSPTEVFFLKNLTALDYARVILEEAYQTQAAKILPTNSEESQGILLDIGDKFKRIVTILNDHKMVKIVQ